MVSALDDVLVADFSRVLAGPYATMLLADLGATVVKVERPRTGDDTRRWGPPFADDGQTTYFQSVNRNKMSIALDLNTSADRAVAIELAHTADVVIANYRPALLAKWGLDYDALAVRNPEVVYCSISGFGADQGAQLPGYDLLVQAMGGLMSITGHDQPTKVGVAVVDVLTGLHAALAVVTALRHRDRTGHGQHLEVTLLGALLASLVNQAAAVVGAGQVPGLLGNAHPSIAPYEVFATADQPMVIAVGNDAQFRALINVIGAPELADDERFHSNSQRVRHRGDLVAALTDRLVTRNADDWYADLTAAGVPCGPINDIAGAFELAAGLGLNPVVALADPRREHRQAQVANPVRYSRTAPQYRSAPPQLDEDREAVLALLRHRNS